jgi:serine/threonine protein kinase
VITPGARVGDFELLARLGRGGQGEAFLARPWEPAPSRRRVTRLWLRARLACGSLGQAEALRWALATVKVAHPAAADSLHDEHGLLAAPGAGHPHLPLLYGSRHPGLARDLGLSWDGVGWRPYLALAFAPGRPLDALLQRGRPPVSWSVAVAAQLAAALAHLHRRGVVHHDVRAANVVVRGPPGRPRATLIDLGAAETPAAPRRRAVYGAPGHLPPERAGPAPALPTPLVDLYGLGALLRELTAGRPVSPALAALIADATAADPERRRAALPSADTLVERLAALPERQLSTCP